MPSSTAMLPLWGMAVVYFSLFNLGVSIKINIPNCLDLAFFSTSPISLLFFPVNSKELET